MVEDIEFRSDFQSVRHIYNQTDLKIILKQSPSTWCELNVKLNQYLNLYNYCTISKSLFYTSCA